MAATTRIEDFNANDPREFHRKLKTLATTTPQDQKMKIRQQKGQLRIGDVILINYREEINLAELQERRYDNALAAMHDQMAALKA